MKSFNELLEIHKRLDELFLEHQRWLLRLDLKEASGALEVYTIESSPTCRTRRNG